MEVSSVHNTRDSGTGTGRNELRALIALMDDPDTYVQQKIRERLAELNEQNVPILDELREEISDVTLRKRVTELIHNITFPSLEQEFDEYMQNGVRTLPALENGQLLLSRFDNPTLRTDLYKRQLDKMAGRLEPSIRTALSHGEQMRLFVTFFFRKEFFKGADKEYMHPDNIYLHKVLQRRRGIPLSLSLIMLFVAHRLDLPLYGVNMPMHFLLKHETDNETVFIDPFNGGQVVSVDQCTRFLRNNGISPSSSHFDKASELEMLARALRNLIAGFEKIGNEQRVTELKRLLSYVIHYENHS